MVDIDNLGLTNNMSTSIEESPIIFYFLLLKDFSYLSFASLIEPLRMANDVANKKIYAWEIITIDNLPVTASNGISHQPTADMNEFYMGSYLWLVTGNFVHQHYTRKIKSYLRAAQRSNIQIGGASTATFLLAFAGIIRHRRCTVHWESSGIFSEEFPNTNITNNIFEIDNGILTCSGGITCLDLMLELITQQQDIMLSNKIADYFLYPTNRDKKEKQKVSLIEQYKVHNPAVIKALTLMLSHLQEPKSIYQLALNASISIRHLERLFQKYFALNVHTVYMHMRLERANMLLRETSYNIFIVSEKCGFSSASYFSKCYKNYYQLTPKETRKYLHE